MELEGSHFPEFRPEDSQISKTTRRGQSQKPRRPQDAIAENVIKQQDLVVAGLVQRGRFAMIETLSKLHEGFKEFKKAPIQRTREVLPSPETVLNSVKGLGFTALNAAHDVLMNIHSSALVQHSATEITAIAAGATLVGASSFQFVAHTYGMIKTFKNIYDTKRSINKIHNEVDIDPLTKEAKYTKEQLVQLDKLYADKGELKGKISKLLISDVPKSFLDVASGALLLTASIGRLAGTIGQAAMPVLMTAVHVVGYVGAGVGFILGIWGLQKSIRGLYKDYKTHRELNNRRKHLDENFEKLSVSFKENKNVHVDQLRIIEEMRLDQDVIKKNREFSLHVFGFCLSTMAVVGAGVAIGAAATHGGAVIGLAVAGLALAGISIGVQVASFIHSRQLGKKIEAKKQELTQKLEGQTLGDVIVRLGEEIKKMPLEQVNTLASYYGVDADTLQKNPEYMLSTIYADLLPKTKKLLN